ncbi:hypothetical protein [Yinghuangia soli]|uniref:DUF5642 domain-containing protein n=1 Tax=Yinghuangia soli TaxID=2908204 RepID=A0AA41PVI6_9ACTN|nr:hypothetical protein [Yinghuangia soli]MCF2525669.1 hypothetical protein [Yinghuangia soli]
MGIRDASRVRPVRLYGWLCAAAVMVLAASGCSSSDGPPGQITVAEVAAAQAGLAPGAPCPFKVDMAAAARKAGIDARVEPGDPASAGELVPAQAGGVPTFSTPPPVPPPSLPARKAYPSIDCTFRVGARAVKLTVVATEDASARNLLLPAIVAAGRISLSSEPFLEWARKTPAPGDVVMPPGGNTVAFVRIPVDGGGDVGMVVQADTVASPTPPDLTGRTLRTITEELRDGMRV